MKVLVAHSSAEERRAALRTLGQMGWETVEASTAAEALDRCRTERPDVVVVDAALGRDDGPQVLAAIKTDIDLFTTAVVLLDRDVEPEQALDEMRHGAHDFLLDDVTPAELVVRVESARRTKELQEMSLSRMEHLEDLIFVDPLTGLYNRRFVERQLQALISSARRHHRGLAVAVLDIDLFKSVNDTLGHRTGDQVLEAVATRLSSRVRAEDVLGRWGGEEFVVVLPDLEAADAAAAAEAFRAELARAPICAGGRQLLMTVSVGWATWEGESADQLVDRADMALYTAKQAGRNRTHGAEGQEGAAPDVSAHPRRFAKLPATSVSGWPARKDP